VDSASLSAVSLAEVIRGYFEFDWLRRQQEMLSLRIENRKMREVLRHRRRRARRRCWKRRQVLAVPGETTGAQAAW
jgi:hypothetical protein